jgi:hypothetical protein
MENIRCAEGGSSTGNLLSATVVAFAQVGALDVGSAGAASRADYAYEQQHYEDKELLH